jgi:SAM-dependent methyltransferase
MTSARAIVPIVMQLLHPESVIDVGCGIGTWLAVFEECGVTDYLGIDGDYISPMELRIPPERFIGTDLVAGFSCRRRFDLAVSVEVGEHLPGDAAPAYVQSLVKLAPAILFSAAVPGQRGIAHVNEQWPRYWAQIFQEHGYLPTDAIRGSIWEDRSVEWWYRQNVLLYLDRDLYRRYGDGRPQDALRPVIHPDMHGEVVAELRDVRRRLTSKEVIAVLPGVIRRSVHHRLGRLTGR